MTQAAGDFRPYVPSDRQIPELTTASIVLGSVLALVFGAANAYAGLKVGMTVSASIPAAVVSMAILRGLLRRGTILENNIVQTIGSSGEALAAGVIFTLPAFFMWGAPLGHLHVFLLAATGGVLGILLMIPLRRTLIVQEHGTLPFPEGTACAGILEAGDEGGANAKLVFAGVGIAALYKFLQLPLRLWREQVAFFPRGLPGGSIGVELTPMLLGVGYLVGPRTAAVMLSGAVLGYLVLNPIVAFTAGAIGAPFAEQGEALVSLLRRDYTRYVGIGAVILGGVMSLVSAMPALIGSFHLSRDQLRRSRRGAAEATSRTQHDLPMAGVLMGVLALSIAMRLVLGADVGVIGTVIGVICAFFFVTVTCRLVGLIGSSANPVSGMTIASLLLICGVLLAAGAQGRTGMLAAMSVAAIVCIAICMAGDCAQDLKTGFLVGATPRLQQIGELIGVIIPSLFAGSLLALLAGRFGFGPGGGLEAPQASAMKTLIEGLMIGDIPWRLIVSGALVGLAVELLGVSALPFAIGVYLPPALTLPIMVGGFIKWMAEAGIAEQRGVLYASGLVAGDALVGIGWAFALGVPGLHEWHRGLPEGGWMGGFSRWGSLMIFGALAGTFWWVASRSGAPKTPSRSSMWRSLRKKRQAQCSAEGSGLPDCRERVALHHSVQEPS
jgi:putative OPT family oligopeptide transporter